jgi:hypothetical protein
VTIEPLRNAILVEQMRARQLLGCFELQKLVLTHEAGGIIFEIRNSTVLIVKRGERGEGELRRARGKAIAESTGKGNCGEREEGQLRRARGRGIAYTRGNALMTSGTAGAAPELPPTNKGPSCNTHEKRRGCDVNKHEETRWLARLTCSNILLRASPKPF